VALTAIDLHLLNRCLAEEPGAWNDFVDRFIGLFVHVINHTAHARSVRLSPEDINDLCAETFVVLLADNYSVLRQFRGKCSLATYLTIVARRIVLREITRHRITETRERVHAHQSSLEQVRASNPENSRIDDRDEVHRILKTLSEKDAAVVRQFHLEGKSYREISTGLGIPVNSIGPTLTRAREKIRQFNEQP